MANSIAVIFMSEADAEAVREALLQILDQQKFVTVSDYLDLVSGKPTFSDIKVGWSELKDIQIKQVGEDKFTLDLPQPINV